MNLSELRRQLPVTGLDGLAFPPNLLGAFRRKSITFCTGLTDETTIVYWFQSRGFTLDLRLPDGAATPVTQRQGWVGDTLWDADTQQMSWQIAHSYQLRDQWPEPAIFHFIGNTALEFAPSGAYVEDWRQQAARGPLLGLRLRAMIDPDQGHELAMDGGLILAGDHVAYAQSRMPRVDAALRDAGSLDRALAERRVTEAEVASYEVSVALTGETVAHSTRPERVGASIVEGSFALAPDGSIHLTRDMGGRSCRLRFELDCHLPDFAFARTTPCTASAGDWLDREAGHLARNAVCIA